MKIIMQNHTKVLLPAQKQICNSCIDAFIIKRVGDYYACRDWNEEVYRTGLVNYIWQMPKAQNGYSDSLLRLCPLLCCKKVFITCIQQNKREHRFASEAGSAKECRKGHHTKENCRCVDEMIDDRLF